MVLRSPNISILGAKMTQRLFAGACIGILIPAYHSLGCKVMGLRLSLPPVQSGAIAFNPSSLQAPYIILSSKFVVHATSQSPSQVDSVILSQESRFRAITMLKRRDTKMSSKGEENIRPTSLEQSQADKPKELVTQILGQRYMDNQKMQKFLESEFGNNWKMEVRMSLFGELWRTT